MADNVTAKDASGNTITFTSDDWTGDPDGASQILPIKIIWGARDTTYNWTDDVTGKRFPVKVGDPLPTGSNVIGGVTQSGAWSVTATLDATDAGNLAALAGAVSGTSLQVSGTFWPTVQPISATSLPLPSNAAQETGGNLATLAGTVSSGKVSVAGAVTANAGTGTMAVSAASLPLPANAAQETGGNLAAIAAAVEGTLEVAGAVTATLDATDAGNLATAAAQQTAATASVASVATALVSTAPPTNTTGEPLLTVLQDIRDSLRGQIMLLNNIQQLLLISTSEIADRHIDLDDLEQTDTVN